ncbi:MAG: serine/threonine-protein kinase [Planctomycetota bacterium]
MPERDTPPTEPPSAHETAELRIRPAARPPRPTAHRPRTIADYTLLDELGRGGMARVFRATHEPSGRQVALKVLHNQGPPSIEARLRFQREINAALRLQHPNIVRTLEGGIDGEELFLAMEIVHGESLKARLERGPLQPRAAVQLAETLARALAFAHRSGVVHRDVKPANVLLDEEGQPQLVDFGLAKPVQRGNDLTATGLVVGTPAYMSPEQAGGHSNVGPLADVYALGATLYEMLTGEPPFPGERQLEILVNILHTEPKPPSAVRPSLGQDLDAVVLTALAKDPSDRYPSCESFAADLRRYLEEHPVVATQPCRTARVERSIRLDSGLFVSDPSSFLGATTQPTWTTPRPCSPTSPTSCARSRSRSWTTGT